MLCTRRPASSVTDAGVTGGAEPGSRVTFGGTSGGGSSANASDVSRRDAGPEPVADQAPELLQRDPLARRAQVRLVREPLVVEREHVRRDRPRVEQRDREVVGVARAERGEPRPVRIRQRRDHRRAEVGVRRDAVGDRREARPVLHLERRALGHARAAAARARRRRGAHLPPPAVSTSTPCSGKRRVVVEARDLEPAHLEHAGVERARRDVALALERHRRHRLDARDRLRRGDDRRQVDRLAEREAVGMEEAERAVPARAAREHVEARRPSRPTGSSSGFTQTCSADVERHEARPVDLEVVARHPVPLEVAAQARPRTDRRPARRRGGRR